ncbi:MAG: 6-phosphogluconolactonase [Hyphomicrobiales bacterium]|nr:6-phosphogluconolactonase [Hyphomicrobiales bacterium]
MSAIPRRDFADPAALADALARSVAQSLAEAVAARGTALLALSGGSTPADFLRRLGALPLAWDRVVVTPVDERWVAADSPRSNARMIGQTLLSGAAAGARFVGMTDGAQTPEAGLAEVEARIAALPWPADVLTLGMGEDGHTASWFPGADGLDEAAAADAPTHVRAIRAPGAPEPRITLTGRAVLSARRIVLQIEGAAKRATLAAAEAPGPWQAMPIRAVLRGAPALEIWSGG